jgi:hypothetical protein
MRSYAKYFTLNTLDTPVQTHNLTLSWSVEKRNNSTTLSIVHSLFLPGIFTAL